MLEVQSKIEIPPSHGKLFSGKFIISTALAKLKNHTALSTRFFILKYV